jgi:hypothetical protein
MGAVICYCFETTIPPLCDGGQISYIDCDTNPVVFTVYENQTYNFCSSSNPVALCRGGLSFNVIGECINGQCLQPVTTTTTFFPITTTTTTFFPSPNTPLEPTNECDVITIFPMGVECVSINPSFSDTFDGSASLYITGGTPPYEILWENGSVGTTINNLGVGEYKATVTDSYGDFLITSTCVLSAETPSPTTTTTSTTPPIVFDDLCMIISNNSSKVGSIQFYDFIYDGIFNDKPSWLSNDGELFMYWNTGTTEEWLVSGNTGFVIYNPNPDIPPLIGWDSLGGGKTTVTVVEGSCDNLPPLSTQLSFNNPSCGSNGSIIVSASGGIPPYQYSKNGGTTFQFNPIFNNLGGGNYSIVTKDSTGSLQTQIVTLTSSSTPITYNIALSRSGNNLSISITPALPNGVDVVFDLITNSQFNVAPLPTSAVNNVGANILVNGSPITPNAPVINNTTTTNLCNGTTYITTTSSTWSNIILNNTSTFSGTLFNTVSPVLPSPTCYAATSNTNAFLNNAKIQGCECCNVLITQEAQSRGNVGQITVPII